MMAVGWLALGTKVLTIIRLQHLFRFSCCNAMQIANMDVLITSIHFHIQ